MSLIVPNLEAYQDEPGVYAFISQRLTEKQIAASLLPKPQSPCRKQVLYKGFALKQRCYAQNRRAAMLGLRSQVTEQDLQFIIQFIIDRDRVCQHCGSAARLQFDHIVSLERGGFHSVENLQLLCIRCNGKKSARE